MPISHSQQRVLDMQVGSKNGEVEKSKVASDHNFFLPWCCLIEPRSPQTTTTIQHSCRSCQCIYSISPLALNMRTLRYYGQRTLVSCTISRFSLKKSGFRCIQFTSTSASDLLRNLKSARSCRSFCGLSVRKRPHA